MATRFIWLTCCCWASRIDPGPRARPKARTPHQHHPLAPSSAHDTLARSPLISKEDPPQPSAAPACQGAAPRDATASARLLRHRRFTRSIRPPVPRSGVAPHRSPQSLPKPYSLVKGDMRTVLRLRSRRCRHLVAQEAPIASGRLSRNPVSLPLEAYYVK